ncbi:uncharacterized protein LOC106873878 [Octopus bimaculoides]|uniref:G-protein coupled receptors family 1 profile domain-containing protein n=1 Tax=Octopus bimaculoides TaxID=37653 RepID=A0A0L8GZB9_OCTBM|nr:uncharacterized protein LOC106873878 [Octopus bimaculoides]XP_052831011.1 uncharacterized protein LOC106873878 [Octopus bimaculoides]XP_052831012.1 uncharacterized protein LOC106873878 [Octopus bimaculoides]XP_052831013.1 uncharacterized protein LOC106873878 [Octopus bimaculoides]XP_052831014.1 uncharacterized protein LOC106873878 [Octopus bimaculoides]XP_052831015.1 uncharacterized protein LOC106873878 [Octopus bimaculoides]XP_052831016.1 uncharacterized protein LOC106873878 [Octopus bima|eukprot:XP_014776884.1 PREDICTED: uncharacterized protein LOC106873878 [Octopus bimaculoides]
METTYPTFSNFSIESLDSNTTIVRPNIGGNVHLIYNQIILPILTYVPPILLTLGMISDSLALVVLRQSNLRQCSIGFYLRVFIVIDIFVRILKPALEWIITYCKLTHIPHISDPLCRLWQFGWNVLYSSATWLAVCMVIDRYIILWHSRKATERCNVFMSKVAIAMVFTGLVVINIHAMWSAYFTSGLCNQINPNNPKMHELVWFWVSMSANYYIPLILLLVFDIAVVLGIIIKGDRSNYFGQLATEEYEMTCVSTVICITFFLITSPEHICYLLEENLQLRGHGLILLFLTSTAAQLLTLFNSVLVFIFCLLFSPSFRSTLIEIFVNIFRRKLSHSEYELATANNNMEGTALEIDNPTHNSSN